MIYIFLAIAFLNAFVDIAHKITLQNVIFTNFSGPEQVLLISIINALIIIPFVLLFTPSGFISDKYPKNRIIQFGALAAVLITFLISLTYYFDMFWVSFLLTLALATQSAIYGPAKLGYIKELFQKREISKVNAYIQAVSMIAILSSIGIFSLFFQDMYNGTLTSLTPLAWAMIALSVLEYGLALKLPTKTKQTSSMFIFKKWFNLTYIKENIKEIRTKEIISHSMLGLAVYWLVIQVVAVSFPAYAKSVGIDNVAIVNALIASTGVGIFIGSILYSKISKNYIETGSIPIGAIGLAVSSFFIATQSDPFYLFLAFFTAGVSGGLFVVPLNSLLQFNSAKTGMTMAGANWIQSLFMLVGLVATTMVSYYGVSPQYILISVSAVALVSAIFTVYKIPQSMVHLFLKTIFSFKYKLNVSGIDNIPSEGGVLLLGNHVSWVDWALLQTASPRPIRFLMDGSLYKKWYLKRVLDFFGVIPTGGKESLMLVAEALSKGECVCVFPEGSITRTGQLLEFKKGFEKVLELSTIKPIVLPFYIRGLWGDTFSRASSNFKKSWDSSEIDILFGKEIKIPTAENVKQEVFQLSSEAWKVYTEGLEPLHYAILNKLKGDSKTIVSDSTGVSLSGDKVLAGALTIAKNIKVESQNVGIILPSSAAGILTNLAMLIKGKTVVNLNYTTDPKGIQAAVDLADIKTIISSRKFIEKLKGKGFNIELDNMIFLEDLGLTTKDKLISFIQVKVLPKILLKTLYFKKVKPADTAVILFSSGSEGAPKGIELSHKNIMGNVKQIVNIINPIETDSFLGILPIFHAFGITVTTLLPLVEGIPVVAHPDPTDARGVGKLVAKHQITIMAATSTFLRIYTAIRRVPPLYFDSLRIVIAGAEKLDSNVRKLFTEKFGKTIYEGYGATETTPVIAVNIPDRIGLEDLSVQQGNKIGTVGLPIPGTAIKIVDPTTYEDAEEGMIIVGGTQLMKGYLKNPEKTSEVIITKDDSQWYVTGDKGKVDSDGFLTIIDRYSRFAKIGGEMVSLTFVEQEIAKVSEIPVTAVSIPDPKKGEKIILVHEPAEDIEAFKKSVKDSLPNIMTPSKFVEVEELFRTGTGKLDFKSAKVFVLESLSVEK